MDFEASGIMTIILGLVALELAAVWLFLRWTKR